MSFPRPFSSKTWLRFKNTMADAMRTRDIARYQSAGIPSFASVQFAGIVKQTLDAWEAELAKSIGEESFNPDTSSWQVVFIEHCKTSDCSKPQHEFLVCELLDTVSQKSLFFKLERFSDENYSPQLDPNDKLSGHMPVNARLVLNSSSTSLPRSSEQRSGAETGSPTHLVPAAFDAMTVANIRAPFVNENTIVLADFRLSPSPSSKIDQCDLMLACMGANRASGGLYDFRYMCFWYARMIYEALKLQASDQGIEIMERLHPCCAKRRGTALVFGEWRWKVNDQDLKFQLPLDAVSPEVAAKVCDIAEPDRQEKVDESQPDEVRLASPFGFFKGYHARKSSTGKAVKPDTPRSVQSVLDKRDESRVLFKGHVARVRDGHKAPRERDAAVNRIGQLEALRREDAARIRELEAQLANGAQAPRQTAMPV